jgi:hypothetical protein
MICACLKCQNGFDSEDPCDVLCEECRNNPEINWQQRAEELQKRIIELVNKIDIEKDFHMSEGGRWHQRAMIAESQLHAQKQRAERLDIYIQHFKHCASSDIYHPKYPICTCGLDEAKNFK